MRSYYYSDLVEQREAVFSDCMRYRYALMIVWDEHLPILNFLMLNPSTADHLANDPTVKRCCVRSNTLGFGSLIVTNIFAYRATDPRDMKSQEDPIGPENDNYILESAKVANKIVCGWGSYGCHQNRSREVLRILEGFKLFCLGKTRGGEPVHPLYHGYDVGFVQFGS